MPQAHTQGCLSVKLIQLKKILQLKIWIENTDAGIPADKNTTLGQNKDPDIVTAVEEPLINLDKNNIKLVKYCGIFKAI